MKFSTASEFAKGLTSGQGGWGQKSCHILFIHVDKKPKNMDAQDGQDSQDGTLPREELTGTMIRYGFAHARNIVQLTLEIILCIVHRC